MTNNTNSYTIAIDDETFTLTLPTDDRAILRLMLELQRDASAELLRAATHDLEGEYSIDAETPLTQFDYMGDHDDYNTAAASLLSDITYAICSHEYETALETLIALCNDSSTSFLIDARTADFSSPLFELIEDPID